MICNRRQILLGRSSPGICEEQTVGTARRTREYYTEFWWET